VRRVGFKDCSAETFSDVESNYERKILSPFDKRECLSLKQASDIAGKSEIDTPRNKVAATQP